MLAILKIGINLFCFAVFFVVCVHGAPEQWAHAKDNGDIYLAPMDMTTEDAEMELSEAERVMRICNASFSIPIDDLLEFNNTAELPDVTDKTGMCYIRCFYEKFGFIENDQLNAAKIREYMWPATGDSIPYCQQQGKNETNACVKTYAIAKCLTLRAIVDARNKPIVYN